MIVALCGQCGWLGGPDTLELMCGFDDEAIESFSDIMKSNRDASYLTCPGCESRDIFYKNLQGGHIPKPTFTMMNRANPSPGCLIPSPGLSVDEPDAFVDEQHATVSSDLIPSDESEPIPEVVPEAVTAPEMPAGMADMMQMFATMMQSMKSGGKQEEAAPRALQPGEMVPPPACDSAGKPLEPGTQPATDAKRTPDIFSGTCDDCGNDFKGKIEGATRCPKCIRKLS